VETPLVLGGRLKGEVRTGVAQGMRLEGPFSIALRCVHRWEERGGSGEHRHTERRRDTLWEATSADPGRPVAGAELSVPVTFELPADQPPVTLGGGPDGILWELSVRAAVAGLDYSAGFELPVLDRATALVLRRAG